MAKVKVKHFSPYDHARTLQGIAYNAGINWSYEAFPTKELAEQFAKDCWEEGYRTRNLHQIKGDAMPGFWAIQYHHYQD